MGIATRLPSIPAFPFPVRPYPLDSDHIPDVPGPPPCHDANNLDAAHDVHLDPYLSHLYDRASQTSDCRIFRRQVKQYVTSLVQRGCRSSEARSWYHIHKQFTLGFHKLKEALD